MDSVKQRRPGSPALANTPKQLNDWRRKIQPSRKHWGSASKRHGPRRTRRGEVGFSAKVQLSSLGRRATDEALAREAQAKPGWEATVARLLPFGAMAGAWRRTGRDAGRRRARDDRGREDARLRTGLPGQAGAALLRRGEVAPRRGCGALTGYGRGRARPRRARTPSPMPRPEIAP